MFLFDPSTFLIARSADKRFIPLTIYSMISNPTIPIRAAGGWLGGKEGANFSSLT
jgi:hypothetical protein